MVAVPAVPPLLESSSQDAGREVMPSNAIPANAENRYEVTEADLPLSCPMPSMSLWNSHPRVYLPIEAEGESQCPYCGAHFVLVD